MPSPALSSCTCLHYHLSTVGQITNVYTAEQAVTYWLDQMELRAYRVMLEPEERE